MGCIWFYLDFIWVDMDLIWFYMNFKGFHMDFIWFYMDFIWFCMDFIWFHMDLIWFYMNSIWFYMDLTWLYIDVIQFSCCPESRHVAPNRELLPQILKFCPESCTAARSPLFWLNTCEFRESPELAFSRVTCNWFGLYMIYMVLTWFYLVLYHFMFFIWFYMVLDDFYLGFNMILMLVFLWFQYEDPSPLVQLNTSAFPKYPELLFSWFTNNLFGFYMI